MSSVKNSRLTIDGQSPSGSLETAELVIVGIVEDDDDGVVQGAHDAGVGAVTAVSGTSLTGGPRPLDCLHANRPDARHARRR